MPSCRQTQAVPPRIHHLARVLADYHRLNHILQPAECILVLGSNDPRVAERGAELFLEGWAPWLLCTGNVGALTAGLYGKPEAEYFAEMALRLGVPAERIDVDGGAQRGHPFETELCGINFRMPELLAAVNLVQMRRLDGLLRAMRARKRMIKEGMADVAKRKGITFRAENDEAGDAAICTIFFVDSPATANRVAAGSSTLPPSAPPLALSTNVPSKSPCKIAPPTPRSWATRSPGKPCSNGSTTPSRKATPSPTRPWPTPWSCTATS